MFLIFGLSHFSVTAFQIRPVHWKYKKLQTVREVLRMNRMISFYNISSSPPFTHLTISKPSIFVLYSSFSMQLPNQDFRGDSNSNLISPLNWTLCAFSRKIPWAFDGVRPCPIILVPPGIRQGSSFVTVFYRDVK